MDPRANKSRGALPDADAGGYTLPSGRTVGAINSPSEWDRFASSWPRTDFMQSWAWGELKRRRGWLPLRCLMYENGKPVGGASLLFRRLPGGWTIAYAPRGPLVNWEIPDHLEDLLSALYHFCRRARAIFLKIDPGLEYPAPEVESRLIQRGFRPRFRAEGWGGIQPKCVMRLDLSPPWETLLARCKGKTRYNIRLAQRKGVTVTPESSEEALQTFYTILQETARRDGFTIRDYTYYRDLGELFIQRDEARLFLARYQGQVIAGAISFIFGSTCWYVYGASSNQHRNVMPNYALQAAMIRWAQERGCQVYDFRGVSQRNYEDPDDPLWGLNRFKAGFNPRFVEWIGEYDWPFSGPLYLLWSEVLPILQKGMKNRSPSVPSGGASDLI